MSSKYYKLLETFCIKLIKAEYILIISTLYITVDTVRNSKPVKQNKQFLVNKIKI